MAWEKWTFEWKIVGKMKWEEEEEEDEQPNNTSFEANKDKPPKKATSEQTKTQHVTTRKCVNCLMVHWMQREVNKSNVIVTSTTRYWTHNTNNLMLYCVQSVNWMRHMDRIKSGKQDHRAIQLKCIDRHIFIPFAPESLCVSYFCIATNSPSTVHRDRYYYNSSHPILPSVARRKIIGELAQNRVRPFDFVFVLRKPIKMLPNNWTLPQSTIKWRV